MGQLTLFITVLYITLSLLLHPSCAREEILSPHEQANGGDELLSIPRLPRRLKMSKEVVAVVNGYSSEDLKTHKNPNGDDSGNWAQGEDGATRQEYRAKKGAGTAHFFTMDYAPVHRRRPIHNKSLPVGP